MCEGLNMSAQLYEKRAGGQIAEDVLNDAAYLFSTNYGVWGPRTSKPGTSKS